MKKLNIIIMSLLLIVGMFVPCLSMAAIEADGYGYEKQVEKEDSKKGFIARLNEDNKKIEFAIKNTKMLIARSRTRIYLPELYLRLAELYIEKSRVVYFIGNSIIDKPIGNLQQLETNSLKNQAIEIYINIVDNFPNYESRDKVHFFMAHEYRELGKMEKMVEQYKAVIREHKDSTYAAEANLLLGDFYSNIEDLSMAGKHYKAVFNYPNSPAVAIARYKLGWIEINRAEFEKAIRLFEESVMATTSTKGNVDTYKRVDVKLESLVDMAYAYTEVYKKSSAQEAILYFKKYAWSRPVFRTVLEKLANRYFIKKNWENAAVLYRYIATLQEDSSKLLEYARTIFECAKMLGKIENADKDIAIIIKALKKERYSVYVTDEKREKNIKNYELYARDIVTHIHKKARSKGAVGAFKEVADAYKIYLEFFDTGEAYTEMEANYAEALFSAKEYLLAGRYYERLAKRSDIFPKDRRERLYSATVSFYNALKSKEKLNYYDNLYARQGLRVTGRLYADEYPDSDKVAAVLFNVAWAAYDSGEYDLAVNEFKSFIDKYPGGKEAKAAVHLVLNIYHSKEDYEALASYGRDVAGRFGDDEFKNEILIIVKASEAKIINSLTITALNDWSEGSELIEDFVNKHKASELGEQALFALLAPSRQKGDFETMFKVAQQFIVEYPDSEKSEQVFRVLIESSLNAKQFRLLASYLELFAQRIPDNDSSVDFLYQAARIRETLGEDVQAGRDYSKLFEMFGRSEFQNKTEILFSMVENAAKVGDIEAEYRFLKEIKGSLSKANQVKKNSRIANYYYKKGVLASAKKYADKAKNAYLSSGKKDGNSLVAQTSFMLLEDQFLNYLEIKLKKKIDNKVVKRKAEELASMEKGYLEVMKYESPEWILAACKRAYEVNVEFARFLTESPLPDGLSLKEKRKYRKMLKSKAKLYIDNGQKYQQIITARLNKWEMTDPKLAKYSGNLKSGVEFKNFSKTISKVEISGIFLEDEILKTLHLRLLDDPDDLKGLLLLAHAYAEKGDYEQALLMALKALDGAKGSDDTLRTRVYNTLGVLYLYTQNDKLAKDAFTKALSLAPDDPAVRVNLAALYQYYGHDVKAESIFNKINRDDLANHKSDLIHDRALKIYQTYNKVAKNG